MTQETIICTVQPESGVIPKPKKPVPRFSDGLVHCGMDFRPPPLSGVIIVDR